MNSIYWCGATVGKYQVPVTRYNFNLKDVIVGNRYFADQLIPF